MRNETKWNKILVFAGYLHVSAPIMELKCHFHDAIAECEKDHFPNFPASRDRSYLGLRDERNDRTFGILTTGSTISARYSEQVPC